MKTALVTIAIIFSLTSIAAAGVPATTNEEEIVLPAIRIDKQVEEQGESFLVQKDKDLKAPGPQTQALDSLQEKPATLPAAKQPETCSAIKQ